MGMAMQQPTCLTAIAHWSNRVQVQCSRIPDESLLSANSTHCNLLESIDRQVELKWLGKSSKRILIWIVLVDVKDNEHQDIEGFWTRRAVRELGWTMDRVRKFWYNLDSCRLLKGIPPIEASTNLVILGLVHT